MKKIVFLSGLLVIIGVGILINSNQNKEGIELGDYLTIFSKLNKETEKEEGSVLVVVDENLKNILYKQDLQGSYTTITPLPQEGVKEGVGGYPNYLLTNDSNKTKKALAKYEVEKKNFSLDYNWSGDYKASPRLKISMSAKGAELYKPYSYKFVKNPSFEDENYYYWISDYLQLSNY